MFDIDDSEENTYYTDMVEMMLVSGNILIEQDCDDLRPILLHVLKSENVSDFYLSIATYTIVYVARETNNWRTYLTTAAIEEFFTDDVEDMAYCLSSNTMNVGRRSLESVMEEFYSFMAEQFISSYEP